MPAVVLRNPNLPHQPVVIDVPLDGLVDVDWRDRGYQIDTNTTPGDAQAEAAAYAAEQEAKVAAAAASFVPRWADETDAAPASSPAPAPSTPSPQPSPSPSDPAAGTPGTVN